MKRRFPALFVGSILALALWGCSEPAPPRVETETTSSDSPEYRAAAAELAQMAAEAGKLYSANKRDEAGNIIQIAQPMIKRLMTVRSPSLEAAIAASDLDDLYGRMLFSNRHYGWARLMFQKNEARWKLWPGGSDEAPRRLALARQRISECDRAIDQSK